MSIKDVEVGANAGLTIEICGRELVDSPGRVGHGVTEPQKTVNWGSTQGVALGVQRCARVSALPPELGRS